MSGIGGTPPGAALDQFLRDSYDVVQAVHRELASIKAVASHLTPVEDLVEFQNEVTALYAKLGVLVAASELIVRATDAGIDMLLAADAPAQRALLGLKSAALREETYFATAAEFDALALQVGQLSDLMDQVLLDLATKVSRAELDAALAPLLARLDALEAGMDQGLDDANARITLLISELETGYGFASATALDSLTTRVGTTETGLFAEAQRTTLLTAEVVDLANEVSGSATALNQLTARVESSEAGIDSLASSVVALNTEVVDLKTGQTGNTSAIQTLSARTTTNEGTITSHAQALTQLGADITDTANQAALNATAVSGLEIRMESSEAGQLALASDVSQLGTRVTDTESGIIGQADALSALTTRVETNELGLTVSSEERTALRSSLTSTGNYLPNTAFAVNVRGWTLFSRGDGWLDAQLERNVAPTLPGALPDGMFALSLTQDEVPSGNAGIRCANVPVEDLASYILSGYLAAENCTIRLEWRLLDGTGQEIGFGLAGESTKAPSARLSDWDRVHATIPVAADGAQLQVQVWITNCHTGYPKAWLLRPQLEPKVGEQVNPSPWMDGVAGIEEVFSTAVQTLETRVTQTEGELDTLAQAVTDLDSQLGAVSEWRVTQHSGSDTFDLVGSPLAPGLRKAGQTTPVHTFQRGLTLVRFDMSGELASATRFDVFASTTERNNLRDALLALGEHDAFLLVSQDHHGIKQADLTAAIESCGALGYANVTGSRPYLLVGRGLAGKGGGVEYVPAGSVPWQDTHISVVNDTPKGLNQGLGEVFAGQASALDSLTTRVTDNETGMVALSSQVTDLDARVDTTETNIGAQGSAIDALDVRVTATEGQVTTLAQDVTTLGTELDAAEQDLLATSGAVTTLTSRVDANETGISTLSSETTALDSRLDDAEAAVSTASTAVADLNTRVDNVEGVTTTQANAITALESGLQSIGGDNLLPNSSFEDASISNASRAQHWTRSGSSGLDVSSSLVPVSMPHSSQAMRVECAAVGPGEYIEIMGTIGDGLEYPRIMPEVPHTWSALVRATVGGELYTYLQWMDSANAILSTTYLPATTATGGWQRLTLTGTPPAGADRVRVRAGRVTNGGGTTIPLFLEVDNVQLQEGEVATAYTPSTLYGDQVNAAAIQTLETRVTGTENDITAISSAQTALDSRIADAEGTLDVQGTALSELTTRVTNAEGVNTSQADSITSLTSRIGAAEGVNSSQATALNSLDTRVTSAEGVNTTQAGSITSLTSRIGAAEGVNASQATAISGLTTRVSDAEGELDTQSAQITDLTTQVAGKASTTALNALTTRVTDAEGDLSAATTSITSLQASTGKLSGNLVPNPTAEFDLSGWVMSGGPAGVYTLGRNYSTTYTISPGSFYMRQLNGDSGDYRDLLQDLGQLIAVEPGQRYCVQALAAAHRCTGRLFVYWYANATDTSSAGNTYSSGGDNNVPTTGGTLSSAASGYLANQFVTVPAGVNYMRVSMRKFGTNPGSSDSFLFVARFAVNKVTAQQTVVPAWEPSAAGIDGVRGAAIQALDVRVTSAEGTLTSQASQITTLTTGLGTKANASAVSALDARVTSAEGTITSTATQVSTLRATLGGSGNLLPNSDFGLGHYGWTQGTGGGAVPGVVTAYPHTAAPGPSYIPQERGGFWIRNAGGGPLPTGTYIDTDSTGYTIPAEAGKRYIGSVYLGAHRAIGSIYLRFLNASGGHISYSGQGTTTTATGNNSLLSNLGRVRAQGIAPAGAAYVQMKIRAFGGQGGSGDSYLFITSPMIEEAGADQTEPSPYSMGAAGIGSITQLAQVTANSANNKVNAKVGLYLDVNGRVSGYETTNNGITSEFSILANVFRVIGGGAEGMEWQNGYLRVFGPGFQRIIGHNFGATGQNLVDYFGPNVGAASASKTNATMWMDKSGNAYWGGSLSAGVLKNGMRSTSISTVGLEIINGPFLTNGNVRTVTISYARSHIRTGNTMSGASGFTAGAGTNTARIRVYRKIGTTAETLWQTLNAPGDVTIVNEADGPDVAVLSWNGSMTVNDTSSAAQTVTYRAIMDQFTQQTVSYSGTDEQQGNITSDLTIISVEQ